MSAAAKREVVDKVARIAERVTASEGMETVDVQLLGGGRQRVLRIFIDKPGGVNHADCESVSRQVGAILDVEDVIPGGSYTLEVSSPGVERKLSKPGDFERFRGQKVVVLLREPVNSQRRWEGRLAGFEQDTITIEPTQGEPLQFDLSKVERANLKFEW